MLAGDVGALLTPRQERKLGRSAVKVWRYLLEARGQAPVAFTVHVPALASGCALPLRTCEWALRRLSEAGLLQRELTRVCRRDGWRANLLVTVLGGHQVERGRDELWVPIQVARWLDAQAGHGGARLRASIFCTPGAPPQIKDLGDQDCGPAEHIRVSTCSGFSKAKPRPALTSGPRLRMIQTKTIPKALLHHPKLSPGDPGDPKAKFQTLTPAQQRTRKVWVKEMVEAYLAAHKAHGLRPFFGLPKPKKEPTFESGRMINGKWQSDAGVEKGPPAMIDDKLSDWKHFAPLFKCALSLKERDIPPQTWAEWVLSRAPGKVMPIRRVFTHTMVDENAVRHAFRNESGYGHGPQGTHAAPKLVHLEQMYRCRERDRRARGITYLYGLPPWYVTKRQMEIDEGVEDPMERFPEAPALTEDV